MIARLNFQQQHQFNVISNPSYCVDIRSHRRSIVELRTEASQQLQQPHQTLQGRTGSVQLMRVRAGAERREVVTCKTLIIVQRVRFARLFILPLSIDAQILPPLFHFILPDCLHGLLPGPFLLSYSVFDLIFFLFFSFLGRAQD